MRPTADCPSPTSCALPLLLLGAAAVPPGIPTCPTRSSSSCCAAGQPISAKPIPESETDQAALFDQLREQLGGPAGPFPGHLRKWKPEHYAAAALAGYSERAVTQIKLARARQAGRSWTDTQARRIGAVGGAVVSAVGSAGSAALGISPPTGWESLVQTGPAWSFSAELSSLAVVLDQPYYPLGGTLTGAVALNLVAPMKSTGVYLKVRWGAAGWAVWRLSCTSWGRIASE